MKPGILRTLLAGLSGGGFLIFLLMLTDRQPPFILSDGVTIPAQIRPGEVFRLKWNIDFRRKCDGTVYRRMIDSTGVVFSFSENPSRFGVISDAPFKGVSIGVEITAPMHAAPGPAYFVIRMEFICNPVHYIWPITATAPIIKTTILPSLPKN